MSKETPDLEHRTGHPVMAFKQTAMALHLLLQTLNRLESQGKLPEDQELTQRLTAAIWAIEVFKLHFPAFRLEVDGPEEKPEA